MNEQEKLNAIKEFNEKYDREEVLYLVMQYRFKKQNGRYIYQSSIDACFYRTNSLEEAKAKFKEVTDHAELERTNPYFLCTIEETKIIDNEAVFEILDEYNYSNIDNTSLINW